MKPETVLRHTLDLDNARASLSAALYHLATEGPEHAPAVEEAADEIVRLMTRIKERLPTRPEIARMRREKLTETLRLCPEVRPHTVLGPGGDFQRELCT